MDNFVLGNFVVQVQFANPAAAVNPSVFLKTVCELRYEFQESVSPYESMK